MTSTILPKTAAHGKEIIVHAADREINRNANNVARVANSQLVSADDKLHPLLSLKNGKKLEKFPDTPKALAKLSGWFLPGSMVI